MTPNSPPPGTATLSEQPGPPGMSINYQDLQKSQGHWLSWFQGPKISFCKSARQKERGKCKRKLICVISDRHTRRALAGFSLPPPRPKVTQRAMKGTVVWTLEARRLWDKKIHIQNWWLLTKREKQLLWISPSTSQLNYLYPKSFST